MFLFVWMDWVRQNQASKQKVLLAGLACSRRSDSTAREKNSWRKKNEGRPPSLKCKKPPIKLIAQISLHTNRGRLKGGFEKYKPWGLFLEGS